MKYLSLLVFTTGAVILGVELSAARLLDPWFGNSQIVWAGLIGLMLFYLALGAPDQAHQFKQRLAYSGGGGLLPAARSLLAQQR